MWIFKSFYVILIFVIEADHADTYKEKHMSITNMEDLGAMHLDVLRELGNIGSGNAATSLASLLNATVDIEVPSISLMHYDNVAKHIGSPEERMISLSLMLEGDLDGVMLQITQPSFIERVINAFYPKEIHSVDDLDAMDLSAIQEIGNISTAAYVNSLAQLTNTFINISPPKPLIDTLDNIIQNAADQFVEIGEQVLYIDENLFIAGTEVKSSMILILSMDSMKVLFDKLGIPY